MSQIYCFSDLPGDGIVESPPPSIVETLRIRKIHLRLNNMIGYGPHRGEPTETRAYGLLPRLSCVRVSPPRGSCSPVPTVERPNAHVMQRFHTFSRPMGIDLPLWPTLRPPGGPRVQRSSTFLPPMGIHAPVPNRALLDVPLMPPHCRSFHPKGSHWHVPI